MESMTIECLQFKVSVVFPETWSFLGLRVGVLQCLACHLSWFNSHLSCFNYHVVSFQDLQVLVRVFAGNFGCGTLARGTI